MSRRFTTARWAALKWFVDHEGDPDAMLMRKHPSRKMLGYMLNAGQVKLEPTNLANQTRLVLTERGKSDHYTKGVRVTVRSGKAKLPGPRRRRSKSREPRSDKGPETAKPET